MQYVYPGTTRRLEMLKKIKDNKGAGISGAVLIIDGLNFFLRSYAVVKSFNENGEHIGGLMGSINSLHALIKRFRPSKCIIIFDGKGGSEARRKIFPQYKDGSGGVSNLSRVHSWADAKTQEENLVNQLNRFIDYLNYLPIFSFIQDGAEADDVIAFIAREFYSDTKTIIVSADRDYLQLVTDKINVWSPIKKKLYTPENFKTEYGIASKNYIYYKIIEGDKSDKIPGVKGIGKATLLKMLPEIIDNDITMDMLYEKIENKYQSKGDEYIFKIKETLARNYQLIQLSDSILSNQQQLNVITQIREFKIPMLNIPVIKRLLQEDGLHEISKQVTKWLDYNYLNTTNVKRRLID